jgi:hypothetical protein
MRSVFRKYDRHLAAVALVGEKRPLNGHADRAKRKDES